MTRIATLHVLLVAAAGVIGGGGVDAAGRLSNADRCLSVPCPAQMHIADAWKTVCSGDADAADGCNAAHCCRPNSCANQQIQCLSTKGFRRVAAFATTLLGAGQSRFDAHNHAPCCEATSCDAVTCAATDVKIVPTPTTCAGDNGACRPRDCCVRQTCAMFNEHPNSVYQANVACSSPMQLVADAANVLAAGPGDGGLAAYKANVARCCIASTCTAVTCAYPMVPVHDDTAAAAAIPCPDGLCTATQCCRARRCDDRSAFTQCSPRQKAIMPAPTCTHACERRECCVATACGDFRCDAADAGGDAGVAYVARGNDAAYFNQKCGSDGRACTLHDCCVPRTCATMKVSCRDGVPAPTFNTMPCATSACDGCCVATKCGQFKCDSDTAMAKPGVADTVCTGGLCDAAQCCVPRTCATALAPGGDLARGCPAGTTPVADQSVSCTGARECNAVCCVSDGTQHTCRDVACGVGERALDARGETITCSDDGTVPCARAQCCARKYCPASEVSWLTSSPFMYARDGYVDYKEPGADFTWQAYLESKSVFRFRYDADATKRSGTVIRARAPPVAVWEAVDPSLDALYGRSQVIGTWRVATVPSVSSDDIIVVTMGDPDASNPVTTQVTDDAVGYSEKRASDLFGTQADDFTRTEYKCRAGAEAAGTYYLDGTCNTATPRWWKFQDYDTQSSVRFLAIDDKCDARKSFWHDQRLTDERYNWCTGVSAVTGKRLVYSASTPTNWSGGGYRFELDFERTALVGDGSVGDVFITLYQRDVAVVADADADGEPHRNGAVPPPLASMPEDDGTPIVPRAKLGEYSIAAENHYIPILNVPVDYFTQLPEAAAELRCVDGVDSVDVQYKFKITPSPLRRAGSGQFVTPCGGLIMSAVVTAYSSVAATKCAGRRALFGFEQTVFQQQTMTPKCDLTGQWRARTVHDDIADASIKDKAARKLMHDLDTRTADIRLAAERGFIAYAPWPTLEPPIRPTKATLAVATFEPGFFRAPSMYMDATIAHSSVWVDTWSYLTHTPSHQFITMAPTATPDGGDGGFKHNIIHNMRDRDRLSSMFDCPTQTGTYKVTWPNRAGATHAVRFDGAFPTTGGFIGPLPRGQSGGWKMYDTPYASAGLSAASQCTDVCCRPQLIVVDDACAARKAYYDKLWLAPYYPGDVAEVATAASDLPAHCKELKDGDFVPHDCVAKPDGDGDGGGGDGSSAGVVVAVVIAVLIVLVVVVVVVRRRRAASGGGGSAYDGYALQ